MLLILIGLLLVTMFFQDLKSRQIHVILPVGVFFTSGYLYVDRYGFNFKMVLFNIVFFLTTFLGLTLYMSIKHKTILNPFKHYFGLGDLIFFLSITPMFVLYNYIVFFIISMVFSMVLFLVFKPKLKEPTVPLAGFSALLLLLVIAYDSLLNGVNFLII